MTFLRLKINHSRHSRKNILRDLLTPLSGLAYRCRVAPHRATGISTPSNISATTDAPGVFFIVATNATERQIMAWCVHSGCLTAGHEQVTHHTTTSMVAQAGQLSGWPVSEIAGSANPVWAIAIMKISTFGDSNIFSISEVAIMATTPSSLYPQFPRMLPGVCRSAVSADSCRTHTPTPDTDATASLTVPYGAVVLSGYQSVRGVAYV
ncbi:TPA: ash family protein [Klebsiella oxytoca]|uniref:Ash family protein n=1 Tax=Klebsiella oxytoca TaxID=571 RepID=A0AAN5LDX0_KLEOX|nr:ash family protein [Klebsiella oxytoca]